MAEQLVQLKKTSATARRRAAAGMALKRKTKAIRAQKGQREHCATRKRIAEEQREKEVCCVLRGGVERSC